MPDLTEHYRFRGDLVDRLQQDLLGPLGGHHEVLTEAPATAYIAGVLYPRRPPRAEPDPQQVENDDDQTTARVSVDERAESDVAMANRQMPSAVGITFSVDSNVAQILDVEVAAATYEPVDAEGTRVEARKAGRRSVDPEDDQRWRRVPMTVPLGLSVTEPQDGSEGHGIVAGHAELRAKVRPADSAGVVSITLTLVNTHLAARTDVTDEHCVFQPVISVRTRGGAAIVERERQDRSTDPELLTSRLLHRHAPMFATGHGCAADWTWAPPAPAALTGAPAPVTDVVRTVFVPTREVLLTDSNPEVAGLGMIDLATSPRAEVIDKLTALVDGYRRWIDDRAVEADLLGTTEYAAVAQDQMAACRVVETRMRSGVALLAGGGDIFTAFQRANQAMAAQRARTQWMRAGGEGEPDLRSGQWRPFQVGFMLLCLEGIADSGHEDRGVADLLWFPTGGGKTEAYLGLIAFTTFLRRARSGPLGGGVTVLMRYTLRLLTLQQFERAATLICAMELMRRHDPEDPTGEPISIGMWVGRAATPNTLEATVERLHKLADGKKLREENPVQLRTCPWCATAMDHADYEVDLAAGTMAIRCRNELCEFHLGLPVHVVDEDVYAVRPTLVIATADKFAQVAWREDVAALFNRSGEPTGVAPPELIVQDELHLISGPLGTLAGLYETVVDLASDKPKVIASTATIRRAADQGRSLFDRTVTQFPPAGLDSRDTWFSVEAPRAKKASRQYVGLFAPSTSQATLLIRTYAALLHHASTTPGSDSVRDAYWTLVGYFNSLRLLSAAELQVHADVAERLLRLATRDGVAPRSVEILCELTSRVDSSDIPRFLRELFVELPSDAAIDVVLATNMISVGVDVDRLGLMAVMGQPQTTAEYIQTTSRVGRRDPGLVVTMLNSTRSRDRSHYENFIAYHSALYRQVESTSVTPFAARARDRALHAALVGLIRMTCPAARPNAAAAHISNFRDAADAAAQLIVDRVRRIAPSEVEATETELDEFLDEWEVLAENGHLKYEAKYSVKQRPRDAALLRGFATDADLLDATPSMWSLRDVDVEANLYLEK